MIDIALLPEFLDPLLSYLSSTLPPPIYSLFLTFLSCSSALFSALFSLATFILSTKPWEWEAQSVIPPIISLFAAYIALTSLYRTTSWMVRTSLWFVKWGTIFGALIAGATWVTGTKNGIQRHGLVAALGGLVPNTISGQGLNAAGGSRSRQDTRSSHSRSKASNRKNPKPKPWEAFETHRAWQYHQEATADGSSNAQKIIEDIAGTAGRIIKKSVWWEVTKSFVEGVSNNDNQQSETRGGRNEKTGISTSR